MSRNSVHVLSVIVSLTVMQSACAQDAEQAAPPDFAAPTMTAERLGELVLRIDSEAQQSGSVWQFTVDSFETVLVYDIDADRMRVMIPINDADALPPEELVRLMQANFDSALDARYAIANDRHIMGRYVNSKPQNLLLWATVIVVVALTATLLIMNATGWG